MGELLAEWALVGSGLAWWLALWCTLVYLFILRGQSTHAHARDYNIVRVRAYARAAGRLRDRQAVGAVGWLLVAFGGGGGVIWRARYD